MSLSDSSGKSKTILTLIGFMGMYSVAALILWFVSAAMGIGFMGRGILILLTLLTFPLALWLNRYLQNRRGSTATTTPAALSNGGITGNYPALTTGLQEAVDWLRNSKLGNRQAGDVIYQLPWFLVAGLPASGKTSLILSSGFDFHLLPSQRPIDHHLLRPTQIPIWRIANDAVFIDSAGRYQLEGEDHNEWLALIELIKKQRKDRPLDGLILPINAESLLRANDSDIEQTAKVLRTRLDELQERLPKMRFPVYLLFTHTDAIEGFNDFFQPLNGGQRAQAWGMTIPLEQSAKAHSLFAPESGYLYYTLMHYRLERLSIAAPAATQLRILDFPLRFTAACKKLDLFATSLFRPNPFHESPLWRGCYFTNATTSGSTASNTDAANEVLASGGYFIQDFFQDVLMRDRDLAASFQLRQHHPERLRKVLVATAAGLLLLLLGGFVTSLVLNRQLTNEALERSMRVDELTRTYNRKDLAKTDETALRTELEAVDALRETLTKLDDYDRHSPPLYLRFGFYSGQTIDPYLRASYFDFTSQHFLQPAVAAMEKDLQAFTRATTTPTGTNPALSPLTGEEELGRCYDLLKTYLMLSQPERAEATFLSAMLADYWKKTVPPDMELMALQQLRFYASQAQRKDVPHYKPNEQLVAEVRRRLTTYPAVNRLYKQITSQVNAKVAPVTLDTIIPLQKRGWLTSTYAVPGSFTIEGYYGYTQQALTTAAAEMSKDDWVMGQAAAVSKDESADVSKLQTLYFREYSAQWQKFTQSIRIQPYKTKEDAVETLKALAANDSPLVLVMSEVVRQTNLTQQPRNGGIKAWFKRLFSQSQTTPPQGIAEVEKEYKAAWQFASESGEEASPFSQYRATLRTVLESLESTSADQLSQTSKQLLTGKDELGLHKAELNIGKLLESFKTDAARDIATLLKQPLGNLRAMLYGSGYAEIEQIWREQLYPKAHTLEAGFPFTDKGEASVTDLSRFFNPVNGQFSLFFNERLATSFEDAQGQWRLKESGVFRFAPDFVSYLNNARQLREAIFPQGSQQPEISYEITLQPLSGIDCAIEIDGIRVETRGSTPQSAKFVWPARAGASGAKITLIQNNQIAEKVFPGEWGLFKMVATGNANFTSGDQIPLAWNVGSATVRATLRPSSRVNPFSRNIFTQLHAPQKLRE